jgi:hypothetical protein
MFMSRRKALHHGLASNPRRVAAMAVLLSTLAGCSADKVLDAVNPVTWYRDLTGSSKNDTPADAANSANLEAGSKEPYPDLGSVPDEPTRGLTEEQKAALAQGLISDREHARYTDQQVRAGNVAATAPAPTAVPEEQLPYAGGPNATPAETPPPLPGPTTPAPPGQANNPGANLSTPASAPPPPASPVAATREAAGTVPTPRAIPQPQTPTTPPNAPQLPPLPPPTPDAPFEGAPAGHPEPPPAPTEVAGIPTPPNAPVRGAPTPPPPALSPTPVAAATDQAAPIGRHTKSAEVAEVDFAAGSKDVPAAAGETLAKVPGLHKQYGGIVRVVAYAPPADTGPDPAGHQLAAYQAALDRANAVKAALVATGIPAADIVAEAARVRGAATAPDRTDIYVEY